MRGWSILLMNPRSNEQRRMKPRTLALICIQREQTRCKMDERSSDKMAAKWMRQKRGPVGSLGVMGVGSSPSEHHIL